MGVAVGVGVEDSAVARGVQHASIGQHRQPDRLARLGRADRQRRPLEVVPDRPPALALGQARGPLDAAQDVRAELGLGVRLGGMPAARVPGSPAVVGVAPGGRVVGPHRPGAGRVRRLVEGREDVDVAARVRLEVVPLVEALPALGQAGRRGVVVVGDLHGRVLVLGMVLEVGADQLAVPGPVVLGVRGGVDPSEAATSLDVGLERRLLLGVQDVAGRGEEDDGVVLLERLGSEVGRVLGVVDGDPLGAGHLAHGGDALLDRVVPEHGGLAKDQHELLGPERRLIAFGARGGDRVLGAGGRGRHRQCDQRRRDQQPGPAAQPPQNRLDHRPQLPYLTGLASASSSRP